MNGADTMTKTGLIVHALKPGPMSAPALLSYLEEHGMDDPSSTIRSLLDRGMLALDHRLRVTTTDALFGES